MALLLGKRIPGRMELSSYNSNVDLGLGETIQEMLVATKINLQANSEAEYFLRNLELIGIAPPNALDGTEAWTINESNLMSSLKIHIHILHLYL